MPAASKCSTLSLGWNCCERRMIGGAGIRRSLLRTIRRQIAVERVAAMDQDA